MAEVLPYEPQLMRFLRRNWRDVDEIDDLRQEVYTRVFDAAAQHLPDSPLSFVLSVARNLLIDRARRTQVVCIEAYSDLEAVTLSADELCPERHLSGRSELRLLEAALNALPSRCAEVVWLRKVEELSQREVAARLGIREDSVARQVSRGIRALAKALGRDTGDASGPASRSQRDTDEHEQADDLPAKRH